MKNVDEVRINETYFSGPIVTYSFEINDITQ